MKKIVTSAGASANSFKEQKMMIATLKDYVYSLGGAAPGLKASRSQNMGKNYLFEKILMDLHDPLIGEVSGPRSIPAPRFTYSEEDGVEVANLKDFLTEELERLKQLQSQDTSDLQEFCDEFKDSMTRRFMW